MVRLTLDDDFFMMIKSDCTLSEVCYNPFPTINFNIFSINSAEVMCGIADFRLEKLLTARIDSTVVMRDTAFSGLMILDNVNRLRLE